MDVRDPNPLSSIGISNHGEDMLSVSWLSGCSLRVGGLSSGTKAHSMNSNSIPVATAPAAPHPWRDSVGAWAITVRETGSANSRSGAVANGIRSVAVAHAGVQSAVRAYLKRACAQPNVAIAAAC